MAQWSEAEAGKLIRRAKSDKSASDEIYREAVEITFPDRENWTRQKEGTDRSGTSWDSSAQVNIIRSANRLSNDFTPQFVPWLEIGLGAAAETMSDDVFAAQVGKPKDEVKGELEGLTAVVQAVFQGPGFPTASNELYIDWHYGQGGMSIQENSVADEEPVVFEAMPLSHFYAYQGANGKLHRWFFWHEIDAELIEQQWPDAQNLPQSVLEKKKEGARNKQVKLASVCYRDYDAKRPAERFRYEVFVVNGNECTRIVERSSRTSPFVTPRHTKLAGENRGRGPVIFALPDIRTANKIVELTLRAAAIAVSGIYTSVDQGLLSPVRIRPAAVMRVRHNPGSPNGPSLARLDTPQRIDFGEILLEKLQENIKKVLGDSSLPPEAGPIRTATEFIQRARELVADQAGGVGRLYGEMVIPAVQRVIDILERKQFIESDGLVIDQFLIEVRMISPLAKGEAMQEVENLVRFVEMLKMLGGDELAALEIDIPKAAGFMADLMSIPMDIRNSAETKAKAIKSMAAQGAAAQGGDPAVAEAEVERMMGDE